MVLKINLTAEGKQKTKKNSSLSCLLQQIKGNQEEKRIQKENFSFFASFNSLNSLIKYLQIHFIAGAGFEPATLGLWAPRATRLLYPAFPCCLETFSFCGFPFTYFTIFLCFCQVFFNLTFKNFKFYIFSAPQSLGARYAWRKSSAPLCGGQNLSVAEAQAPAGTLSSAPLCGGGGRKFFLFTTSLALNTPRYSLLPLCEAQVKEHLNMRSHD